MEENPFIKAMGLRTNLRMMRHLFEDEGDEFALALADYIREHCLQIDEEALEAVRVAARTVRR